MPTTEFKVLKILNIFCKTVWQIELKDFDIICYTSKHRLTGSRLGQSHHVTILQDVAMLSRFSPPPPSHYPGESPPLSRLSPAFSPLGVAASAWASQGGRCWDRNTLETLQSPEGAEAETRGWEDSEAAGAASVTVFTTTTIIMAEQRMSEC